ncbi:hypothetical protein Tco_0366596 [Tanacetum coccineum]
MLVALISTDSQISSSSVRSVYVHALIIARVVSFPRLFLHALRSLNLSLCHCLLTLSLRSRSLNLYPSVLIVFAALRSYFENEHVVMNPTSARMRHLHLYLYMNPKIKQLAIKRVDEYGFVIRLDLVRLTLGSVGPFYSINIVPVIR